MSDVPRLAGGAIAHVDVKHAPIGIAAPRRRVEHHLAKLMAARVEPHAENLAPRTFERVVRRVGVGPLDQHALMHHRARRRNRRRHGVAGRLHCWKHRGLRNARRLDAGVFHVRRVELAVRRVLGIEVEPVEAVAIPAEGEELLEQAAVLAEAVEIEIGREGFGLLVEIKMGPETTGRKRRCEPPVSSRIALTRAIDDSLGVSAPTSLPSTGIVMESSSSIVSPGNVGGVCANVPAVHKTTVLDHERHRYTNQLCHRGKFYRLTAETPRRNVNRRPWKSSRGRALPPKRFRHQTAAVSHASLTGRRWSCRSAQCSSHVRCRRLKHGNRRTRLRSRCAHGDETPCRSSCHWHR